MVNRIRTRFAPSPTGYMHVGNLRTALYAYLIAKHEDGDFILRIEDTDQERFVEGSLDVIYKTLEETGLEYDEGPLKGGEYGPYVQSERKEIYRKYAQVLVDKKEAYYCFCDKERLDMLKENAEALKKPYKYDKHCLALSEEEVNKNLEDGKDYVIRQNNPTTGETSFNDVIYGTITVDNTELEDMVLIKSDGFPTYNFANVVDDYLMDITHIVRGSEYLSSSPKYNRLYGAFDWDVPTYVHAPPIMKDSQHKLSKRSGDASYQDLIDQGFLKEAIVNYIALLGWNPGTTQEIFSLKDLIKEFDFKRINKSPAIFDIKKLKWINQEYIKKMSLEEFYKESKPYIDSALKGKDLDGKKIASLLHTRTEVFSDINEQIDFFYELPTYSKDLYTHKRMKTNPEVSLEILTDMLPFLKNIDDKDWNHEYLHDTILAEIKERGKKNGQVLWPMRIALAGKTFTPGDAFNISDVLGKKESIERIEKGIELLKNNK